MLKLNPFKLLAPFAGSNTLTGVFIDHDYMYATNRYVVGRVKHGMGLDKPLHVHLEDVKELAKARGVFSHLEAFTDTSFKVVFDVKGGQHSVICWPTGEDYPSVGKFFSQFVPANDVTEMKFLSLFGKGFTKGQRFDYPVRLVYGVRDQAMLVNDHLEAILMGVK